MHKNIGFAATVFPIWMLRFGARVDVQMSNKDSRQFTFGPSFPSNTTLLLLPLFIMRLFVSGGLGLLALGTLNAKAFSPSSYPQKVANCHAFNRVLNESHPIDIKLRASAFLLYYQPSANYNIDIPFRLR